MSLTDTVNKDIKSAMLAKESRKLDALRAIKATLIIAKTEKKASGLVPKDIEMKILQKLVKQRKESAELYRSQNRSDLVDEEEFQAGIIESYLPEQLDKEQLKSIIKQIIDDTSASSIRDMGKVMGIASKKLAGKADNKTIADLVKEILA